MLLIQAKIFAATKAKTHLLHQEDFRLHNLTVATEIVSKVASIEIMSGSRFVPVGAFRQKKIEYKKAVHGSSYPEGFTIFLERKKCSCSQERNVFIAGKTFPFVLPF
ncbi:hypothetical protein CEXT_789761 [Caerostris extrusa]|uniref:Uncharacterized protein n=1 Tax=Caerostris extrusa TaxID=172846 RepID=A0AAV4YFT2_CAEEX|nr:hypothetical protein CEXT_789761 [Caerostris extrusa]